MHRVCLEYRENVFYPLIQQFLRASLVTQVVKNPSGGQETWVQSLDWEDPLEKGMATHSSFLLGKSHGQRSLVEPIVRRVAKSWT